MENRLLEMLKAGALAVTANERLAASISDGFNAAMAAEGALCWDSPRVASLARWLRTVWEDGWPGRVAASPSLIKVLWEEVVERDAEAAGMELLDVSATAEAASSAYAVAKLYRIPLDAGCGYSEECDAFARWCAALGDELDRRGWIDDASLSECVAEGVRSGALKVPGRMIFCGFDELPPAHRGLIDALIGAGVVVERAPFPEREGAASLVSQPDADAETRRMAERVLAALEADPGARIGVVALDTASYLPLIERALTETLTPLDDLPFADRNAGRAPLFDITLGNPLSSEPVADTALALLAACYGELDVGRWRALVMSPYWDSGASSDADENRQLAGAFAGELLSAGRLRLGLEQVRAVAARLSAKGAPGATAIAAVLGRLGEAASGRGKRPPSKWAETFAAILKVAGWSRGASLESREYQALEKMSSTLAALAVYDRVCTGAEVGWMLEKLRHEASQPFRPKVSGAPVQVMGMLEAAGLEFDLLWVLGATDATLPPPPSPTPFIPYEVQRAHGVRQATPEGVLERSRGIIRRLLSSADEVVVSRPLRVDDAETGVSPLVVGLERIEAEAGEPTSLAAQVRASARATLERVEEAAVPVGELEEVRGGTTLFANQAQCPFRAFIFHRLGLREREEPEEGITRAEQGSALHAAMWRLAAAFDTAEALEKANAIERRSRVEEAAEAGVAELRRAMGAKVSERLLRVERGRLVELLDAWLELDGARPEFRVLEREAARELVVGGVPVKLRIDRVDQVGGGKVVFDYKTAAQDFSRTRLDDERLTEPQLPLYALACEDSSGVAYAYIRRGECKFAGVGVLDGIKGVRQDGDWEERKRVWGERLATLGREFKQGVSTVDPAGGGKYCNFCGLDSLCRRDPAQDRYNGEGEEE